MVVAICYVEPLVILCRNKSAPTLGQDDVYSTGHEDGQDGVEFTGHEDGQDGVEFTGHEDGLTKSFRYTSFRFVTFVFICEVN